MPNKMAVSLRLNQRGRTKASRASRRERPRCPQVGGDQARYLIALAGGFRSRISARLFQSRTYSAMFPQSPRAPQPQPPPRAPVWSTSAGELGPPHQEGGPLGQRLSSAASRRRATPWHRRTPLSPGRSPALCKRSSSLDCLTSCSHHKAH